MPKANETKPNTDQADAADSAEAATKRETFGKVQVLGESKTHRVLADDRFVWKEAK